MRPFVLLRDRALEVATLALFIVVVYAAVLQVLNAAGVGRGLIPSIAATAIVAVSFPRVRDRVRRGLNRMLYGQRLSPHEVLSRFSERVAGTHATEEALARIAAIVAEGTRAARAEVWLRAGEELRLGATSPSVRDVGDVSDVRDVVVAEDPPPIEGADLVVPIRHTGELLGALAVLKRAGEPVAPAEHRLLADLGAQAGLVLQNVRLGAGLQRRADEIARRAATLRDSRRRIVEAHDTERRLLERDIHDGAQQHLVALTVELRLARTLCDRQPELARRLVAELRSRSREAIDVLRDVTRGIHPAALASEGLAAALAAQTTLARAQGTPVELDAPGIGRCPAEIESAVYFSCMEALQNAAKHAGTAKVTIRLYESDGELGFRVTDDGAGFDPAAAGPGSGLENMHERMRAVGGSVEVTSRPGEGTTIRGRVPVERMSP